MTSNDETIRQKLTDSENPRTPVFFRSLRFTPATPQAQQYRHAESVDYHARGFVVGSAMAAPKPLSKCLPDDA